jgi:mannosyltransferase
VTVTAGPEQVAQRDRDSHGALTIARSRRPLAPVAVAGISAVVAAGVVLRHLGTKPLWRDEAVSVSVAARPALRILSVLPHHDANAGLFYLLLHVWMRLGHSPAWARGFSALCFTATAAVVAWAGSRWRGWETGLALGVLVAFNPFLLYYGQEARPYALAVLLATVSTVALFAHLDRPASRTYLVATIALVYADLFAVLFVAAVAAVVLVVQRRRHQALPGDLRRSWWLIAAATAPLAAVMMVFERGQISWVPRSTAQVLATTFTSMSGGWLGLEIVAVLATVALITTRGRDRLIVVALAAGFALPPLILWSVGQIFPDFIDRYVICSALALAGLAGAGLAALRERLTSGGRLVALAVLVGLLLLGGQRVARIEATPFKVDNAPAVVGFIAAHAEPGDAVAYAGGGLRTVVDAALPHVPPTFPFDVALAPGGQAFRQHDLYAREVDASELLSRLATVNRIWMVTDPSDQQFPQGGPFAQLKTAVMATYGPDATMSFGSMDVTLLVRRP